MISDCAASHTVTLAPKSEVEGQDWWDLFPFTSHRIRIADDLWTCDRGVVASEDVRTKLVVDVCGGSLRGKTIVDLGCLEGAFATEFARLGALSIGIEARKISIERCELVRQLTGLTNVRFIHADVKEELPRWEKQIDVVFLAGLLYHVNDPYSLLKTVYHTAKNAIVIDTHIAHPDTSSHNCSEVITRTYDGREYKGRLFGEYDPSWSREALEKLLWAAWSDDVAFWPLELDLMRMLKQIGFRVVEKVTPPAGIPWQTDHSNRVLVVCRV